MKQADIQVGKTYRNKGRGNTTRTVLGIGYDHRPDHPNYTIQDGLGVSFVQHGWMAGKGRLYLSEFAAWAASEVKE